MAAPVPGPAPTSKIAIYSWNTRLRKVSAGSGKSAASLPREVLATVRAMSIIAQVIVRADSVCSSHEIVGICRRAGARLSLSLAVAVTVTKKVREAIAGIAEDAWTPIKYTSAVAGNPGSERDSLRNENPAGEQAISWFPSPSSTGN
ncbi:hypothetical protein [Streptomyces radiopugnans]|uniref:hypothetical protein n=1 Tax=Streptomyces radiopugnans TaxID=403935 RepID=UPI003F1AAAD8